MAIQPLREHPLLKGKKLIGRGMFSAVFETGPDTVLKLTVDSVNYALLVGPARMIGAHFPHVLEDQGGGWQQSRSGVFV